MTEELLKIAINARDKDATDRGKKKTFAGPFLSRGTSSQVLSTGECVDVFETIQELYKAKVAG